MGEKMTKHKMLEVLKLQCLNCQKCVLAKTRTNVVFSDGNPETAKAVLIGEAPGENEDLTGTPFVGRAGRLLNEFLEKAGIDRQSELYIINTVKCRPPKNRVPEKEEKLQCENYLMSQIDIIRPKVIIFCGATALKSFSESKIPISKIRGEIIQIGVKGRKYPAIPIFHPSYLLRQHSVEQGAPRNLMLQDLKKIKSMIDT